MFHRKIASFDTLTSNQAHFVLELWRKLFEEMLRFSSYHVITCGVPQEEGFLKTFHVNFQIHCVPEIRHECSKITPVFLYSSKGYFRLMEICPRTALDNVLIDPRKISIFREPIKTLSRAVREQISAGGKQPLCFESAYTLKETCENMHKIEH